MVVKHKKHLELHTYFGRLNLPLITQWNGVKYAKNDEFYCMTLEEIEDIRKIAEYKGLYFGYYRNSIGYKCQISKTSLDEPQIRIRGKRNE